MGAESKCPTCGKTFSAHPGTRTRCAHGGRKAELQAITTVRLDAPTPNRFLTRDDF